MSKIHFHEIVDRLSEYVYFDILNEIVGGVWTESIVHYSISGEEHDAIEFIMPIKKAIKQAKRS